MSYDLGNSMSRVKRPRSSAASSSTEEPFVYPTEIVMDHTKKVVNLCWFADWFRQQNEFTVHLDYNLAVYVIAEQIHQLPLPKWKELLDKTSVCKEAKAALDNARIRYLIVKKCDNKGTTRGWSNHVLNYLTNLFTTAKSKPIAILLLLQLMPHYDSMVDRKQAFELIGGRQMVRMIQLLAYKPGIDYTLELPVNLRSEYKGKGFPPEDLRYIMEPNKCYNSDDSSDEEESPKLKSYLSWTKDLNKLRYQREVMAAEVKNRKELWEQAEKDLREQDRKIARAESYQTFAKARDDLIKKDMNVAEETCVFREIKRLRELYEDHNISDEEASKLFLELRKSKKPTLGNKRRFGETLLGITKPGKRNEQPSQAKETRVAEFGPWENSSDGQRISENKSTVQKVLVGQKPSSELEDRQLLTKRQTKREMRNPFGNGPQRHNDCGSLVTPSNCLTKTQEQKLEAKKTELLKILRNYRQKLQGEEELKGIMHNLDMCKSSTSGSKMADLSDLSEEDDFDA